MLPETAKSDGAKGQNPFDREVRHMVNTITSRVGDFHKPGDDEAGIRMVTLAGTNMGATMRTELDDQIGTDNQQRAASESEPLATYVNSNFQAVNNSMMLGSSYSTHDPGVHLDISHLHHAHQPADKHGKANTKKKQKDANTKKTQKDAFPQTQHSE
ncbi:uncharacterized protein LOC126686670 [Mercurialis annua]|uniref:uncharacterized protein LOC126686670 n=1 Tax=Mercurialis annua TaxID=3986 RepID=UPI00215E946B|nr:uncharacterized protein LOC126686670 [Mercurialis annua]